jgi:hypothetical protein
MLSFVASNITETEGHVDQLGAGERILVVGIDTSAGIQAVQPAAYLSLFKEYTL